MPDLLEQGADWLNGQRHQHLARTVTYERDGDPVELAATIGRTEFEQVDEYGAVQRVEARDFIVRAMDLVLGGAVTLSRAGDRIRETVGSETFIYEVMAPGMEPAWRYSDPYRLALRIHTKHVATESAP